VDDNTVATVLRMLSKFVGEDKFLKGVSLYLKKHMYSNTVSRDLWEGIGEATGILSNNLLGVLMTKRVFYRTRHSKDNGELGLEGR
jgi:aminopeptidase 2